MDMNELEWKVERKSVESPANAPAPSSVPQTQLESALKTAIHAAHEAEKYGTMIGYVVRFSEESIKCMAITALIGMQQR
jgi:NAD dependent epimerase/dehydratase family enzyme